MKIAVFLFILLMAAIIHAVNSKSHGKQLDNDRTYAVIYDGQLLGGYKDGKEKSTDEMAELLQGGETYQCFNSYKKIGIARGDKPQSGEPILVTLKDGKKEIQCELALHGKWNPAPRLVNKLNKSGKIDIDTVACYLKSRGLSKSKPNIKNVWQADIDNDKHIETIISAVSPSKEYQQSGKGAAVIKSGDYTVILVRRGNNPHNIVVVSEYYFKKTTDYNVTVFYGDLAFYDINGDSKLEIIASYDSSDEVLGYLTFAVNGKKARQLKLCSYIAL